MNKRGADWAAITESASLLLRTSGSGDLVELRLRNYGGMVPAQ